MFFNPSATCKVFLFILKRHIVSQITNPIFYRMFLLWYDLRKAQHERKQLLKNNLYHKKQDSLIINNKK